MSSGFLPHMSWVCDGLLNLLKACPLSFGTSYWHVHCDQLLGLLGSGKPWFSSTSLKAKTWLVAVWKPWVTSAEWWLSSTFLLPGFISLQIDPRFSEITLCFFLSLDHPSSDLRPRSFPHSPSLCVSMCHLIPTSTSTRPQQRKQPSMMKYGLEPPWVGVWDTDTENYEEAFQYFPQSPFHPLTAK